MALVLKTREGQPSVGSNPTLSANFAPGAFSAAHNSCCGVVQLAEYWAHNSEVAGSNPAPASI